MGLPQVIPEGLAMVRQGRTYLELGQTIKVSGLTGLRQLCILSMQYYDPWVIPAALDFLVCTRERYALTWVVSHTFPLEKSNEALELADWSTRERGTPVTRAIVTP